MANLLAIHLNKFKTIEDLSKMLEDNGISILDAQKILTFKNEGYTKLFIDSETHKLKAFCHISLKGDIKLCEDYVSELKNMKSLDVVKEPKGLSIDSILDKINNTGLNSLNKYEKAFLENNSK
jgi:hypothetical protein